MKREKRTAPLLLVAAFVAGACTVLEPHGNTPAQNHSAPSSSVSTFSSSAPKPPELATLETKEWVQAVRLEQWQLAANLIDALSEQKRQQPEIRYVRARVALALGDYQRTLTMLEDLEGQLPLLSADIGLYRAEAQLHAGRETDAAKYFARSPSVRSLTKAALAWSRAGQPKQARTTIDRAIYLSKKQ
ncbi:MAG: hypothetical protein CSA75_04525, partial [Sorangium cellulosum]